MRHQLSKLLIGLLFFTPVLSWALPSDRDQPINIEADHAQLDEKLGVTQYKGRAILTQGTLRIEGDIITFYYDADRKLKKAVAQGKPATYKQVQQKGEEPVRAHGLQMEYYARDQKIHLLGDGYVWQNGDEFHGNRIEYDIARNVVNANSEPVKIDNQTKQSSGRVHIIINPDTNKSIVEQPEKAKKQAAEPVAQQQNNTATPAAKTAVKNDSAKSYPIAYTSTRLNVRTGPGTQYDKIDTFSTGSELIVLTEQGEWRQVRGQVGSDVVIGWVHQQYLTEQP